MQHMYESPDSAMLIVEKAEPRLSAERIGAREDADSVANTVFNYYYKINSVIRKKLGIGPTETNLDIYLRKLMSEIDGAS